MIPPILAESRQAKELCRRLWNTGDRSGFRQSFSPGNLMLSFCLLIGVTKDGVEFDDGFVDVASIVAAIPYEFNGLLDLCVCHPTDLVIALEQDRPNLLKKAPRKK